MLNSKWPVWMTLILSVAAQLYHRFALPMVIDHSTDAFEMLNHMWNALSLLGLALLIFYLLFSNRGQYKDKGTSGSEILISRCRIDHFS